LIGGRDFIIHDTSKAVFSEDSLDISYAAYTTAPIVTDGAFSGVGVFKTIEIVANVANGSRLVFVRNNASDVVWAIQVNMTSLQFASGVANGIGGIANLCGMRHAISATYGSHATEVKGVYLDSIKQSLGSINNSWSADGSGRLSLGGRARNFGTHNFGGSFYSVRIYDKELTDAEIAHNYAVDKERFGL
jgi:hypothetical protein